MNALCRDSNNIGVCLLADISDPLCSPPPSPTPTISIIQIFSSCFMYIIFTVLCSIYRLIPCSLSLLVRPCLCGALCVLVCPLVRSTHIRGGHFQTYIDSLDILLAVHLSIIYYSLFPTWYTVFPSTYNICYPLSSTCFRPHRPIIRRSKLYM